MIQRVCLIAAFAHAPLAYAGPVDSTGTAYAAQLAPQLEVYAAGQTNYDDNLYRLPDYLSPQAEGLGPEASRGDRMDVGSAGLSYQWLPGVQVIDIKAGVAYNRFAKNSALNNTSRYAKLQWDWRLADRWSGKAGADYEQALANFGNNHFFAKDLLQTHGYLGEVDWQIGAHLFVNGTARHWSTTHSAASRQVDDYVANAGSVGVHYLTQVGDEYGWEYNYTHGSYPHNAAPLIGKPYDQKYDESTSGLRVKYALTGKTRFEGFAGYLKRVYPGSVVGNFSGNVWNAAVTWAPGAKTQVVLKAWRQLAAHLDSQSDYFVSNGASIAPTWAPTEKLSFSLQYSRDRDQYIGSSLSVTPVSDTRRETVGSGQFIAAWAPRELLRITATYRFERRASTVSLFTYDDNLETIDLRLIF